MASLWQRIGSFVCSAFIMNSTWMRLTKELDEQLKIDQQDIFHSVSLFLSTVMFFLFFSVFRSLYAPLRPIMAKKGGIGLIVLFLLRIIRRSIWNKRSERKHVLRRIKHNMLTIMHGSRHLINCKSLIS